MSSRTMVPPPWNVAISWCGGSLPDPSLHLQSPVCRSHYACFRISVRAWGRQKREGTDSAAQPPIVRDRPSFDSLAIAGHRVHGIAGPSGPDSRPDCGLSGQPCRGRPAGTPVGSRFPIGPPADADSARLRPSERDGELPGSRDAGQPRPGGHRLGPPQRRNRPRRGVPDGSKGSARSGGQIAPEVRARTASKPQAAHAGHVRPGGRPMVPSGRRRDPSDVARTGVRPLPSPRAPGRLIRGRPPGQGGVRRRWAVGGRPSASTRRRRDRGRPRCRGGRPGRRSTAG